MIIGSICHPKKQGLIDHAEALQYYGTGNDEKNKYYGDLNLRLICRIRLEGLLRGNKVILVVWDNSFQTLLNTIISRIIGARIYYYYHEPGGVKEKLYKTGSLSYSFSVSIVESLFKLVSTKILVAKRHSCDKSYTFCPLLFRDDRPSWSPSVKNIVGFIGKSRSARSFGELSKFSKILKDLNVEIKIFPDDYDSNDYEEKVKFLSKCLIVWNVYTRRYNQSGVTGDCIMSGVPIIHSEHEPWKNIIFQNGLGYELKEGYSDFQLKKIIEDVQRKARSIDLDGFAVNDDIASNFGGKNAFMSHWKLVFDN
jgi:hypothetical protein